MNQVDGVAGMRLRAATQSDIPALHALRLSVRENRLRDPSRVTPADYNPYVMDPGMAWVAEADGQILGFAMGERATGSIWALFVAPQAERRGVGRALLERITESLRQSGAATLTLSTDPDTRAYRVYLAAGWQEVDLLASGEAKLALTLRTSRAMLRGARFAHTNLVARDWRRLAGFYMDMFGCVPVPPERNYSGPILERGSGIPGAALQGMHLRLPGCGEQGPTLEVFTYASSPERQTSGPDGLGFGHIAFAVDSVFEAQAQVIAAGGVAVGEVVTSTTSAGTQVTWCYVRDPEGNIIELQSWQPPNPHSRA